MLHAGTGSDSDSNYEKERELEEQDRRKEALEIVAEMQLTAEQLKVTSHTSTSNGCCAVINHAAAHTNNAHFAATAVVQSGLRTVPPGFGDIFDLPENQSPEQAEQFVKEQARRYAAELRERVAQELPNLHWFPRSVVAASRAVHGDSVHYCFCAKRS
jgi:hypothetical protein